jgi:hypothetical protein
MYFKYLFTHYEILQRCIKGFPVCISNARELAGYADLKTTQWYTHITEITRKQLKDPFGNLGFTLKEDKLPLNIDNQK